MDIVLQNDEEKRFISADGDIMSIIFGEPDRFLARFNEKHKLAVILPQLFEKLGTLGDEVYQDEVRRLFPEYKNAKPLSEKQIQELLIDKFGFFMIDGRDAVLAAEEYFGIKIAEDYKLPEGLSPRQFHLKLLFDLGCVRFLTIFDERGERGVEYAYMWAWQNLHFKNYDTNDLRRQLMEIIETLSTLNPQLRKLKVNFNRVKTLWNVIFGVIYGFPLADIEFYCNEQEKGISVVKVHKTRMLREMAENGLPKIDLMWIPATETIVEMGKRFREKKGSV